MGTAWRAAKYPAVGPHATPVFAKGAAGDGGWYLAASIVPSDSKDANDDELTIWATESDPTAEDWDGTIYAVNQTAKDATSDESRSASPAPSSFSEDSDAAKRAESCAVAAPDR